MPEFSRYAFPAPPKAFVVRLVQTGDQVMGFIRQVGEKDDPDAFYSTEQVPADEALRLAVSRARANSGTRVFIDMDAALEWHPEWGLLHS